MHHWTAVIIKKTSKGAVVRQRNGTQEVLVEWTVPALVEINKQNQTISSDPDAPWIENETEKALVKVGGFVRLLTRLAVFPRERTDIVAANLDILTVRVGADGRERAPRQLHALIIYHDFKHDTPKGDSGTAFAKAVIAYYENELRFYCHSIKASVSYAQTVAHMALVGEKIGEKKIDRLLIVTHGSEGQLWLGNPDKPTCEDTVALPVKDKAFVSPTAFGDKIKSLYGAGLAISIFSCDLAHGTEGLKFAKALASAAQARAVYAATDAVFLHANTKGISTGVCNEGVITAHGADKAVSSGTHLPIFTP